MICPTCGYDPRQRRPPLQLFEEFLLADTSDEKDIVDRLLAMLLKGLIFLLLMALIIVTFGVAQYLVSFLMFGFISHLVAVILTLIGIFVLGYLVNGRKKN